MIGERRRLDVVVNRYSCGTACSCLLVIIPTANNAQSGGQGAGISQAPSMQITSIHARSVSLKLAYGVGETLELSAPDERRSTRR
jgi:hypothetical protein